MSAFIVDPNKSPIENKALELEGYSSGAGNSSALTCINNTFSNSWAPLAFFLKSLVDCGLTMPPDIVATLKTSSLELERMLYVLLTKDIDMKKDPKLSVKFCYYLSGDFEDIDVLKVPSIPFQSAVLQAKPDILSGIPVERWSQEERQKHYNAKGWSLAKNDSFFKFRINYYREDRWQDFDWYEDKEMNVVVQGIINCKDFQKTEGLTKFATKLATNKTGITKLFKKHRYRHRRWENGKYVWKEGWSDYWEPHRPHYIKFFSMFSTAQITALMFQCDKDYAREFFADLLVLRNQSEGEANG